MLIASLDFALHGSCKQLHRRVSFPVAARSHLNKMPCDFTPGNDPHCDIPVIPHSVRQANPPSRSTQSTSRGLLAQDTPQDPDIPSCPLAHRKLTLHSCRHGFKQAAEALISINHASGRHVGRSARAGAATNKRKAPDTKSKPRMTHSFFRSVSMRECEQRCQANGR